MDQTGENQKKKKNICKKQHILPPHDSFYDLQKEMTVSYNCPTKRK